MAPSSTLSLKKAAAKKAATKTAEQKTVADNIHSGLVGKTVRVICPEAGYLWQNSKACVEKASGDKARVGLTGTNVQRRVTSERSLAAACEREALSVIHF